ncbi:Imm26 family immunity protein [Flavobacterium alkalisoli]|uniref:Imm26 family immunity protein n=1 Tax=Flavobacterium alkalisoli TaxID=2602769 RepID=UPI003A8D5380
MRKEYSPVERITMNKKNKLNTGTIIKIPLEHNLGFVLAKFINLNEILNKPNHNEFIYVYNKVFKEEEIVIDGIDDNELLLGGVFVLDLLPVIRNKTWETIGYLEPKNSELKIPDFKDYGPILATYEKDAKFWYCIKNFEINNRIVVEWDEVHHLEKFTYYSHDIVVRRLTMEVIRQSDKKIENYYSLKEWKELAPYYNTLYTPVYSSISFEIRGEMIKK